MNVEAVAAPSAQKMLSDFWEKTSKDDIEKTVQTWLTELKTHTDALDTKATSGIVTDETKEHLSNMVGVIQKLVQEKKSSQAVEKFLKNNGQELKGAADVVKRLGGQLGEELGIEGEELDLDKFVLASEGVLGKYQRRASTLLMDTSDIFKDLVNSEEGEQIREEGTNLMDSVSNTKGAKMLLESAKRALTSERVGKFLEQAPGLLESRVGKVEKDLGELNVKDLSEKFVDESDIVKKIVKEDDGVALIKDLQDSRAVKELRKNAKSTVDEVKGKGVESTMDETASQVLQRSESIVKEFKATRKGHQLLAEGLKAYKRNVVNTETIERAVSSAMEEVDAPLLLELGEKAWEDEGARNTLVAKLTDISLEFLLKSLPAIAIPPISGVDNDVAYTIDGLDMSGFVIDKKNVSFVVCDEKAIQNEGWDGTVLTICASKICSKFPEVKWSYRQNYFPYASGNGVASAELVNASLSMGFKLMKETMGDGTLVPRLVLSQNVLEMEEITLSEKGSTMGWIYNMLLGLFADVVKKYVKQNVTEALDVLADDFFGNVNSAAEAINMAPILMRLTGIDFAQLEEYEVTKKRDRVPSITIEEGSASDGSKKPYSVTFRGGGKIGIRLGSDPQLPGAAIVIAFTKGPGGEVLQAEENGSIHLGDILLEINSRRIVNLPLQKVMQIFQQAERPITLVLMAKSRRKVSGAGSKHAIVDIVFAPGPIGLELTSRETNGKISKGAMIRSFKNMKDGTPGAAERCGKLQASMILHACNDEVIHGYPFEDIMKCLRQASRPMVLRFLHDPDISLSFRESGPIGLRLGKFNDFVVVTGFVKIRGPGESTGVIKTGHIVHMLGGQPCTVTAGAKRDWTYSEILNGLRRLPRPVVVRFGPNIQDVFADDTDEAEEGASLKWCDVTFGPGAMGITFKKNKDGRTVVTGFPKLESPAQKRGDIIRHGMVLLKLNGEQLGNLSLEEVIGRLRTSPPPRTLVFRDQELYSRIHKER
jgi:hypothetical protein